MMSEYKTKVTLELGYKDWIRLETIAGGSLDIESLAGVIMESIQFMVWVTKEAKQGNKLYMGKTSESVMEITNVINT
jgi:hypothetical protein